MYMNDYYVIPFDDELYHHGVKGMKWGVRRYQNPDGTLTAAGQRRLKKNASGRSYRLDSVRKSSIENAASPGKNTTRVLAARQRAVNNSKAQKELDDYISAYERKNPGAFRNLYTTPYYKDPDNWNRLKSNVATEEKRIIESYVEKLRGAYLKDLGMEDTEAGRKYLEKIGYGLH